MQQLLNAAIRGILPDKVRVAISQWCFFFNAICTKVIDPKHLDELENEASIIICQLEMYFPPAFFDLMIHLVVHLVREIRLCRPVYLRWMYSDERYMKVLKSYTNNQYRPEASIVERYIAEEAIEFCSVYIKNASPHGLHYIMNTALGCEEHPGCVRVAGHGVTISSYFEQHSSASNSSTPTITPDQLGEIIGNLKQEWRKKVEDENKKTMDIMKKELVAIKTELSQIQM